MTDLQPSVRDEEKVPSFHDTDVGSRSSLSSGKPEFFKSRWTELAFVMSIFLSQLVSEFLDSGITVLLPALGNEFDVSQRSFIWPVSSFSLTMACFLLPIGRAIDKFGGCLALILSLLWNTVCSIGLGFSPNSTVLIILRALQGVGVAAILPAGTKVLCEVYPPGRRRNVAFGIYASGSALGFYSGFLAAGGLAQIGAWRWWFWLPAIVSAITLLLFLVSRPLPYISPKNTDLHMGWTGLFLVFAGLALVVFAVTDSSSVENGWRDPLIYVTFTVGCVVIICAAVYEVKFARHPIISRHLASKPGIPALIGTLILLYGSFGILLVYAPLRFQYSYEAGPLLNALWFTPLAAGVFVSTITGALLKAIPGTAILFFGAVFWMVGPLLLALAPESGPVEYWRSIFPSLISITLAMETTYTVTSVYILECCGEEEQGFGGAFINSLLNLAFAIFVGIADAVQNADSSRGLTSDGHARYASVFWLELSCAALALLIMLAFVRIPKLGYTASS